MQRLIPAIARLVVAAYLTYLLWFLGFEYDPTGSLGFRPPLVLWVIDVINLFIHEAGHFLFRPLGQTLSLLGGSLGLVHDWNQLLRDHLTWAQPISTWLRWIGLLVCCAAVVWLVVGLFSINGRKPLSVQVSHEI